MVFLEEVIATIYQTEKSFDNQVFVLPSKRAGIFLKKYLASHLTLPIFTPRIYSIEELVEVISGLKKSANFNLILQLYEAFLPHFNKEEASFESYVSWAHTLLADFNDIDRNLVPQEELFDYLTATQRLKTWGESKDATPLISKNLKFWGQLKKVYQTFTENLLTNKIAHQGLLYRTAVTQCDQYITSHKEKTFHFIGFNALTTAEEHLFDSFMNAGIGKLWWDLDPYFLEDPIHEAGFFIRKYLQRWPQSKALGSSNESSFLAKKDIQIIGVPKFISQAKMAGVLLKEVYTQESERNVALVLSDEALLPSVLQVVPITAKKVNITMGLPLDKTALYSFFSSLFELHTKKTTTGWYYGDILTFLSNPFSKRLLGQDAWDGSYEISHYIKKNNLLYIHPAELEKAFPENAEDIAQLFPENISNSESFIQHGLVLITALKPLLEQQNAVIELDKLHGFLKLFNQLALYSATRPYLKEINAIRPLFNELVALEQIDFKGEPLGGLQIMGVLESRNLDFDTVILTSVNEGVLPAGKNQNSFIPYDIKKEFGLPTHKEKDAIFAYHFYRLLQRAKKVHLLYNTQPDVLLGNEKSRFLSQLLTDTRIASNVRHIIASPELKITVPEPKSIKKSSILLSHLETLASHGFSPTSLSNFIKDPYVFYLQNVLKIKDANAVEETIAANTFGTIIHDTLEEIYTPFLGQKLAPEPLLALKSKTAIVTKKQFEKHYLSKSIENGQNLIAFHVIQRYINRFITLDSKRCASNEITLVALEKKIKVPLTLKSYSLPVHLKGTLDRLERFNGIPHIIDYKTGNVATSELEIQEIHECFSNEKRAKAFQLLCYALMEYKETGQVSFLASVVPIKQLGDGFYSFATKTGPRGPKNPLIDHALLAVFEAQLILLLENLLDPNQPFEQKELASF